jgi:hypothetical protein
MVLREFSISLFLIDRIGVSRRYDTLEFVKIGGCCRQLYLDFSFQLFQYRYFLAHVITSHLPQCIRTRKRGPKYSRMRNLENFVLNRVISVTNI